VNLASSQQASGLQKKYLWEVVGKELPMDMGLILKHSKIRKGHARAIHF